MNTMSWESGGGDILGTKMEKFVFFYKKHIFYTLTQTWLVGTNVYAMEKVPENH